MMSLAHWIDARVSSQAAGLVNHLWQSTAFVLPAWLLAWSLRAHSARARYWVWMAASVKFLLPFSFFIAAGEALRTAAGVSTRHPALSAAVGRIAQPYPRQPFFFTPAALETAPATHHGFLLLLLTTWLCGVGALALSWARSWRQIRAAARAASPLALVFGLSELSKSSGLSGSSPLPGPAFDVPVLATTRLLEPGVFGIVRPVLLLPESIMRHLSPEQLRTVVAHELCHIRRRDNLTAALHMAVTALFWFHPAVWWIEARLLTERERACDEAVLAEGSDAELYAESILSVCKFYAESPLACMPGVTGGDLKQRIVRIMTGCLAQELSAGRKAMLAAACVLTAAIPVTTGFVTSTSANAQTASAGTKPLPSFEVASVRPNHTGKDSMSVEAGPFEFNDNDTAIKTLIEAAFDSYDFQVVGGPGWINSDRYDIKAKIDESMQKLSREQQGKQMGLMLQSLLLDRFHFKYHRETRIFSVYSLQIAKNGPKLHEAKLGDVYPNGTHAGDANAWTLSVGNGEFKIQDCSISIFAKNLGGNIGHVVIDKTGLQGKYDFTLVYAPDHEQTPPGYGQAAATTDTRPPIFTALQEQLGLKLVSEKAPLEVIVIDHIEPPSPN